MNIQNLKKIISIITTPLLFLFIFITYYLTVPEITQDLGRQILLGGIIANTGHVPNINLFSYTVPNASFINSDWLSGVIFYFIDKNLGLNSLLIFTCIIGLISYAVLYLTALNQIKLDLNKLYLLNILFFIYFAVSSSRTFIRPELFSFFFLSIFMYILFKYKKKYTKLIFLLIPLEFIWVNLHIYFIIGLLLIFIFLLERAWDKRKSLKDFFKLKENRILIIIFLGAGLICLANPNTVMGALFPLFYSSNYVAGVVENYSMLTYLLNEPNIFLIYDCAIIAVLFIFLFKNKQRTAFDVLLAITFTIIALSAIRNLPLFVFGTFPVFALSFFDLHFAVKRRVIFSLIGIFIFLIILFSQIWLINQTRITILNYETQRIKGIDFFVKNDLKGPIFNNFNIGSYLLYRLYPSEKVFVDERPEAYPLAFFSEVYFPMQTNISLFNSLDKYYNFNSIVLAYTEGAPDPPYFTLINNLMVSGNWTPVYLNGEILIFLKDAKQNKNLIRKFSLYNNGGFSKDTTLNNNNLNNLGSIFKTWGWYHQEANVDKLLLKQLPYNCAVLKRIIQIDHSQNLDYSSYLKSYQKSCGEIFF